MKTYPDQFELFIEPGTVKGAIGDSGARKSDVINVPIGKIHVVPGFNVRIFNQSYLDYIQWIKRSILKNGYYPGEPLSGYVTVINGENCFALTSGHTRLEAAKLAIAEGADIEFLPFITAPKGTDVSDLTVGLVTNNGGRPLQPYEVAVVVKRLINFGNDVSTVAQRLGITESYVNQLLVLMSAPRGIHDLVINDQVAASVAISAIQKNGNAKALELLLQSVKTASERGSAKIKPRDVRNASGVRSNVKFSDMIANANSWFKQHAVSATQEHIDFLSALTGSTGDEITQALQKQLDDARIETEKKAAALAAKEKRLADKKADKDQREQARAAAKLDKPKRASRQSKSTQMAA